MNKKILSFLLTVALILSMASYISVDAKADGPFDGEGNINTGDISGSGLSIIGADLTITADGSYLIEGTGEVVSSIRISVSPGVTATVTVDNVNLVLPLPFNCGANSNVTIILRDNSENIFNSTGSCHAGIYVPETASLTISTDGQSLGNGSLKAYGCSDGPSCWSSAGIGGGELKDSGKIVINGGNIFAKGGNGRSGTYGSGAPGIGAGHGSSSDDITINGGVVTAIGGDIKSEGPGIGGGSSNPSRYKGKISINGGLVRAYSGKNIVGAGGPAIGFCESVTISNTADVVAYSSGDYPAIHGEADVGHTAHLISLMLDSAVAKDTDIRVTEVAPGTETFEIELLQDYRNFAATVSGANNYSASLTDGSKVLTKKSDGSTQFTGFLTTEATSFDYVAADFILVHYLFQTAETSADGKKVILTFDKDMDNPAGKHNQFAVTADGNDITVTVAALGLDNKTIELTLDGEIIADQVVKVSYSMGTVTAFDGAALASFTDQPVTNIAPAAFALISPEPETKNGLTAEVTFNPAGPLAADKDVRATVTLTGQAVKPGKHELDLTSIKAGLTTNPLTITVTAGQDLTQAPVIKNFDFIMPSEAVNDFNLNHIFSLISPLLQKVETSRDGQKIILTYDMDMADPGACLNNFVAKVNGQNRQIINIALGSESKTIELTLETAVAENQTVTLSHPPNGGCIQSVDGAIPASFTDRTVTNNVVKAVQTGGGGSGGGSYPIQPEYKADMKTEGVNQTPVPVKVDSESGSASADLGQGQFGQGSTRVIMPAVPGINTYIIGIPVPDLSTDENQGSLTVETNLGNIVIPSNMLTDLKGIEGERAQISIGEADKKSLSESLRVALGDRPLITLSLFIDGKETAWNNQDAPVKISLPYKPTAEELKNPEAIIVWYIDGAGNVIIIPNGHYDEKTGMVTFYTSHFSYYGLVFNDIRFQDVSTGSWYEKAVNFIAAREITKGTGQGKFSPKAKLSRSEFIVLLMNAYGIEPDKNPTDNFADAGNTWYTEHLAAAKRLGLSAGVGDNMFAPKKEVSRQEMFTLVYNTLNLIKQLPEVVSGKSLDDFTDAAEVAPWAREVLNKLVARGVIAGTEGRLMPENVSTRAEMAAVLYKLLTK